MIFFTYKQKRRNSTEQTASQRKNKKTKHKITNKSGGKK